MTRLKGIHPLWLLILLAIFSRMFFLESRILTEDEIDIYLACSKGIRGALEWCSAGDWPPLYHLVVTAFFFFRQSDLFERLPSAIAAVLALPVTWAVLRRFFRPPIPFWATLLLVFNPFQIYTDRSGKMYSLLTLLSMSAFLLLLKALKRGELWRWLLYSVVQAANLYTSYFALPVFMSHSLLAFLLCVSGRDLEPKVDVSCRSLPGDVMGALSGLLRRPWGPAQRRLSRLALASGLTVILFSPWMRVMIETLQRNLGQHGFTSYVVPLDSMTRFALWVYAVMSSGGGLMTVEQGPWVWGYWMSGTAIILVSLLGMARIYRESIPAFLFFLFLALFPFVWLKVVKPSTSVHPRFLISFLPFFTALACQGILDIASFLQRRSWVSQKRVLLVSFGFLACLWSSPLYVVLFKEPIAWPQAMSFLDERLRPGDILIGGRYHGAAILERYMPRWRGRVAFVPMWEYERWFEMDPETGVNGLPRFFRERHRGARVWFATACEKDIPEYVWRGIRAGFTEEAVLPGLVSAGTVLIYRQDL